LIKATITAAALVATQCAISNQALASNESSIERGRYLIDIGSCNDCHTAGYIAMAGKTEESQRLRGNPVGFRGDWGTTYGSNLRHYLGQLSEDQWVQIARKIVTRPPMPWFVLHDMAEQDLRSIYRYVTYLGPAGNDVPDFLLPNQEPKGPYIDFPRR
jgi:mono/diheme cytochrome c family protein